jgi:hypothetical protein
MYINGVEYIQKHESGPKQGIKINPFFVEMWQHNNVMWELTNFCFSLKFPFVPFWCYKLQSCGAFSIYVTPYWPIYPYNIFRQGTKRTQCGGTPFVLDKLQIAHIAHPTFAFNLELSSFQHSTFRLNRIKWKWRHLIFWTQFCPSDLSLLSREQDDFSTLEDIP